MKEEGPQEKRESFGAISHDWRFFVGLFLGVSVGAPIAIVCLNYLVDQISLLVISLVICLVFLVCTFGTLFVFRERVLGFIFRGAKGAVENLVTESTDAIKSVQAGHIEDASNQAWSAVRELVAIYVWGRVRWQMVTWTLGLVASIAIFVQGMLVFRQNKLFTKQNEIINSQGIHLENQNAIAQAQNDISSEQKKTQDSQFRMERLAIRNSIFERTFSLTREIELEVQRVLKRLELNVLSGKEEEWAKNLDLGALAKPNTVSGLWSEIFPAGQSWAEYSNEFRELNESEINQFSKIRRFNRLKAIAAIRKASIQRLLNNSPNVLLGYDATVEEEKWGLKDEINDPIEYGNDITQPAVFTNEIIDVGMDGWEPLVQLSSYKYKLIAAQFDSLNSNDLVDKDIVRAAKGDFLLALMRTGVDLSPLQNNGANLRYCEFSNRSLDDLSFQSFDMEGSVFKGVDFEGVDFQGCNLQQCKFVDCRFTECRFRNSYLPKATDFESCDADSLETFVSCWVKKESWLEDLASKNLRFDHEDAKHVKEFRIFGYQPRMSNLSRNKSKTGRTQTISGPVYYQALCQIQQKKIRDEFEIPNIHSYPDVYSFETRGKTGGVEKIYEFSHVSNHYRDIYESKSKIRFDIPFQIVLHFSGKINGESEKNNFIKFMRNLGSNIRSVRVVGIAPSKHFSMKDRDQLEKIFAKIDCDFSLEITPNEVVKKLKEPTMDN